MRGQEWCQGRSGSASLSLPQVRNALNAQKQQILLGAACGESVLHLGRGGCTSSAPHLSFCSFLLLISV